jgi:hypothetical protein
MMYVQAIDQMYLEAAMPQESRKVKEPERLGPEVIGRKIVNPGIDQDQ